MAMVIMASSTGAPGTSTTALGLALNWPRPVLLVDADRVPSQLVEVGFLGSAGRPGGGLLALTQAHREGRDLSAVAWELSVSLDDDPQSRHRFLSGFPHPAAAELFTPMWPLVGSALAALHASGIDVIVDAGRIGSGVATGLLEHCDGLLICTRSTLRAMAGVRMHLAPTFDSLDLAAPTAKAGLLVIGADAPYSNAEIAAHFGVRVVATIPVHSAHAAVLSDGAVPGRKFHTGALVRSYRAAAQSIGRALLVKPDLGTSRRDPDPGPSPGGPR